MFYNSFEYERHATLAKALFTRWFTHCINILKEEESFDEKIFSRYIEDVKEEAEEFKFACPAMREIIEKVSERPINDVLWQANVLLHYKPQLQKAIG